MSRDDYTRGWERGIAAGQHGKSRVLRWALFSEQAFQRNFDYWNGYITGYWIGQSSRLPTYHNFSSTILN